uniref:Uncharacterized protein n=1 Tax=Octopus bimaculoides TaxID=37653 RepID=A0A0L8G5J2_OCTBM
MCYIQTPGNASDYDDGDGDGDDDDDDDDNSEGGEGEGDDSEGNDDVGDDGEGGDGEGGDGEGDIFHKGVTPSTAAMCLQRVVGDDVVSEIDIPGDGFLASEDEICV